MATHFGFDAIVKPRHPAPLNALRAFEAAARLLSFQAAAARLFVTPAAVSHQVKRLEEYLGVPLFHRGHRAVVLTPQGEALAASLGEVFGLLDLALHRAMAHTAANLRVSTMESFAAKWLAPRLQRFHRDFPDVKLHVETGDRITDLQGDGIDIAIRYGPGGYTGVVADHFLDAPVFPVCAPSLAGDAHHPLAQPDDLRHHTLIHDESAARRPGVPDWATWLRVAGATRVVADPGPVFTSIHLAQEAAAAGHGVALGVGPLVEDDMRRGRLVRPFQASVPNAYAFWIVRRQPAGANPVADAFCRWLREEGARETVVADVVGS